MQSHLFHSRAHTHVWSSHEDFFFPSRLRTIIERARVRERAEMREDGISERASIIPNEDSAERGVRHNWDLRPATSGLMSSVFTGAGFLRGIYSSLCVSRAVQFSRALSALIKKNHHVNVCGVNNNNVPDSADSHTHTHCWWKVPERTVFEGFLLNVKAFRLFLSTKTSFRTFNTCPSDVSVLPEFPKRFSALSDTFHRFALTPPSRLQVQVETLTHVKCTYSCETSRTSGSSPWVRPCCSTVMRDRLDVFGISISPDG